MISYKTLKCPSCGADITYENDAEHLFCTYCGTKIIMKNDNEYIIRTIDEAKIKETEYEATIKLKEMEEQSTTRRNSLNFFRKRIFIYIVMAVVGYAFGLDIENNPYVAGFIVLGILGIICVIYGSLIHAFILLRKK